LDHQGNFLIAPDRRQPPSGTLPISALAGDGLPQRCTSRRASEPPAKKPAGQKGADGEAIVGYCDPSATPVEDPATSGDLEPSDFPEGEKGWRKTEPGTYEFIAFVVYWGTHTHLQLIFY
jgi:hypothetical protein